MNELVFAPLAERDLEDIGDYIAQDNPRAAVRMLKALHDQCALVARRPLLYPVRADIGPDFRHALVKPYGIWYRILPGEVRIERILHGARDLPTLLKP